MKILTSSLVVLLLACPGCPATGNPKGPATPAPATAPQATATPKEDPGPKLTPRSKIKPDRLVWAYVDGVRRAMDVDEARSLGLTVVDLSDDWVPYIFWSQTPGKEDYQYNAFLDTYVDLANDRIDGDGVALEKWKRNYLEVFGIPASLSVLRKRFVEDEQKQCFKDLDLEVFKEYHGPIKINDSGASKRELKRWRQARDNYKRALRKARVRTLDELLAKRKFRGVAKRWRRYRWRHQAIRQMQKRLVCEHSFERKTIPRIKPYIIGWNISRALKRFERKHNVYGWGLLYGNTVEALGRTARQNNYESLKRVLSERVASAARLIEDGTVRYFRAKNGEKRNVRNTIKEFTAAMLKQMGLTDEDKALAFVKQYKSFSRMWVAVKLPALPEYYSDNMNLSVVIDRGDVWYDFPNKFDRKGRLRRQARDKYPHMMLYVTHKGEKIPLVRWRTTIGSWQPELINQQEYYKYKVSDVGKRVWKNIIAGPVWVPPKSTPTSDMVKIRRVRNRSERIVAHPAFGPGYGSAYGLVAGFHVTKSGRDNQVRTHGSVNYMSIKSSSGFSHGCHRLFNFRAVRLFSFVLGHRPFVRKGQSHLRVPRRFEHRGEEFQLDIWTRGYKYEMTPPVPVNVLEGNVQGKKQSPIEKKVKKPTLLYQEDLPTLKKKKPAVPGVKKNGGGMDAPQNI